MPNDHVDVLTTYANNGFIGGNGVPGLSNLQIDLTTNPGFTTVTATSPPSDVALEIRSFTLDEETGAINLVWTSEEGAEYRIVYGTDLSELELELEEAYPADEGDTTSFPFNRALLFLPGAERVFFRVEKRMPQG